jgi:serine/threonine protein kinase
MLSIEEGKHYPNVEDHTQLPYTPLRQLSYGGSSNVMEVRLDEVKATFALKTLKFHPPRANKERQNTAFLNEIAIIRGLGSHRHIIAVYASCSTERAQPLLTARCQSDRSQEVHR